MTRSPLARLLASMSAGRPKRLSSSTLRIACSESSTMSQAMDRRVPAPPGGSSESGAHFAPGAGSAVDQTLELGVVDTGGLLVGERLEPLLGTLVLQGVDHLLRDRAHH